MVGELVERAVAAGMLKSEVLGLDPLDQPTGRAEHLVDPLGERDGGQALDALDRTPSSSATAFGFQPWTTPVSVTTAGTAGTPRRFSSARAPGSASMSTESNGTPQDEQLSSSRRASAGAVVQNRLWCQASSPLSSKRHLSPKGERCVEVRPVVSQRLSRNRHLLDGRPGAAWGQCDPLMSTAGTPAS